MKKMIWLTTLFVLSLVLIIPTVFALMLDMVPAADQPGYNSDKRLALYGERDVSQKFVSQQENLLAIATSIRNPNLKNKKEITFNLYDKEKGLIRTAILNGQNIEDGDFVKFVFPVIPDSLGKEYSFTLSTSLAGPEETIEVFYIDIPTESVLEFIYDEKTYPGGIPLVTFHKPNSRFEVVKEVYFSLFSRLLSPRSQRT